jgi:hypothetical protein
MARPRIDIQLPREPFTTQTLQERYPHLSVTVIHQRIKEWLIRGQVKQIGKRTQATAQRKAWFLYEPTGATGPAKGQAQRTIKMR